MKIELPIDPLPHHRIRLQSIADAMALIDPLFMHSPHYDCEPLSDELGCALTLKVETANPIRSFKGRGGFYLVASRFQRGLLAKTPVVSASAGNWGQAIAYACRSHSIPITIFASVNANPLKINMMKRLGANIILAGSDFDAAKLAARAHVAETGGVQLEDGFDVEASEGAGTIGVELMRSKAIPDVVLVPLGNGAMLTGIARWLKAVQPSTQVIGIQSRGADAMEKSWRQKTIITSEVVNTIADGIGVRIPVAEALADMEGLIDDVILVDDSSIIHSIKMLFDKAGLVVEPSGAAGIAALLENPSRFKGARVCAIICGGNITREQVQQYIG